MTTFRAIWFIVANLGFAISGWLCLFRTNRLVEMGRKNYAKSKSFQNSPLADIVLKPWYPTLIRVGGIFIWLWVAAYDCLYLFRAH